LPTSKHYREHYGAADGDILVGDQKPCSDRYSRYRVWAFVFEVNRREGWAVATMAEVRVRRVYDEPNDNDGVRVLVDRIWPRGMTKARAALNEWCKEVAPSTELRKWYSHDPAKFEEFTRRYDAELEQAERAPALQHLRDLAADTRLTLLTASKDVDISEATVLAAILNR
jgi:uncharacterized protein YeaO (DUF488 family)